MNMINKRLFKSIYRSIIILGLVFTTGSCEEVIYYSDLEVSITGTLSGNPRSDIEVTLYYSKTDATNQTNPVTSSQVTDNEGKTTFYDLEYNIKYWIRSDVVLTYIKQTSSLRSGFNEFSFTVL